MKLIITILTIFLLSFNISWTAQRNDSTKTENSDSSYIEKSNQFIKLILSKKFDDAFEFFDTTMKKAFPIEKFQSTWNTIESQVGKLEKIVKKETIIYNEKKVVIFTTKFEKMYLDIRIVYSDSLKIGGFFLAPNYDFNEYKTPPYANIKTFDEEQVTFGKKGWELKGILTIPKKTEENKSEIFPVVILVHGSGPHDMDESIGPNKPFKDLAWGLATKRIAVFRYNKRTNEHPAKILEKLTNFTLYDETIEDAKEAVKKMISMSDIDPFRVYVLGHSLGGMAIPRIADGDKLIAGYIIMAGNARPLQELLPEQYQYIFGLDGKITDEEQEQLDSIKAQVDRVNDSSLTKDTPINLLPLSTPANYWLDIRNYQPAVKAKEITSRMLILQGERDYQVTTKDFEIWKQELAGKEKVEFKLYPKLNHIFMEGKGKSRPEEYTNASHIPEYVIDDIVKFILRKY
ncbi:DUF3887 domain-containing protein [Bacteroidetes/Chlorobi group bacterium ChocPot_Mid]|nr:MAG: DUF3887 domain-containing protein [Bacteroidetes/Chlorobi group bacterium ChocPot_Mid]